MNETHDFCTFSVAGHLFGVDLVHVQEVIREQAITRVPLASPVVRGLINLRGQIVAALDLRRRLELPEREIDHPMLNVVVRTDDGAVSLLVDDIGDVIRVAEATLDPVPETLRGTPRELIRGVHKLQDQLLLILDVVRIVNLGTH